MACSVRFKLVTQSSRFLGEIGTIGSNRHSRTGPIPSRKFSKKAILSSWKSTVSRITDVYFCSDVNC